MGEWRYLFFNKYMRRVVIILSLCVSVFGVCGFAKAEDFSSAMTTINTKLWETNGSITSVKWLIKNYCNAVLTTQDFTENQFNYSGRQSVFVALLCSNVGWHSLSEFPEKFKNSPSDYFKLSSFHELGIEDMQPISIDSTSLTNNCDPWSNMTNCDISTYISKLFSMIINDYTNLKQPNLYGFIPGKKPEELATLFSKTYFDGVDICANKDGRSYPDTCKALKKYITDAQKLSADVQIFRPKNLIVADFDKVCDVSSTDKYSLLLCGLYGDTTKSLERFLNLTYNELFYYQYFMNYYSWIMSTRSPEVLKTRMQDASLEATTRITNITNELTWSQQALSLTMRMLRDDYTAFPLHIWFLMYQEDLITISEPLSKLYTPLNQLYYLLRNVQEK